MNWHGTDPDLCLLLQREAGPASQALHAQAAVLQAILTLPAIGLCNHTSFKSSVAFVPRVAKLQRASTPFMFSASHFPEYVPYRNLRGRFD